MTRKEHYELWLEHSAKARAAIHKFATSYPTDWDKFTEYRREDKLANKHYGIARAMWTKEVKKILERGA